MASDIAIAGVIARKVARGWFSNKRMYIFRVFVNSLDVLLPALAAIYLVRAFGSLDGWNLSEVEILVGLSGAAIGVGMLFGGAFDSFLFDGIYRSGEFEASLLRPLNPIVFLAASNLRTYRVGRIVAGLGVVVVAIAHTHHVFTLLAIIPFSCVFSGICMSAMFVVDGAALLYFGQSNPLTRNLPFATADLGYYPNSLYPSIGRVVAQFVLGIGASVYLPVSYALGKGHNFGLASFLIAPVVTLGIVLVSRFCWLRAVETFQKRGGV